MTSDPLTALPQPKLLLTPREAAATLGISRSAIYVLLARGDIASVHIGSSRRVPTRALEQFVERLHPTERGSMADGGG